MVSSLLKHTLLFKNRFYDDTDTNILRMCVPLLLCKQIQNCILQSNSLSISVFTAFAPNKNACKI